MVNSVTISMNLLSKCRYIPSWNNKKYKCYKHEAIQLYIIDKYNMHDRHRIFVPIFKVIGLKFIEIIHK